MKKGSLELLNWKDRLTFKKDTLFGETDFKCEGTKFQIIKFKPHSDIKPHYHKKRTELFYIVKGTGKLIINKTIFRVKPDDFFLCEVGDIHQFVNDTDDEFIILVFRTNEPKEDDLYFE